MSGTKRMPRRASTSELISSLRCTELLADSPSTSMETTAPLAPAPARRKSAPARRQPLGQLSSSRKRPSAGSRLNAAVHPAVRPICDPHIQFDPRAARSLLEQEDEAKVNNKYCSVVQHEVTEGNREAVVLWLLDVCKEEHAELDVFPLSVLLMDCFLSAQNIFRRDAQAVGGACLFIASKIKAPCPMNASRISFYTAESVSVQDLMSWELLVLKTLKWRVSLPTAFDFMEKMFVRRPELKPQVNEFFIAHLYDLQKSLKSSSYPPSVQACICLLASAAQTGVAAAARSVIGEVFGYDPVLVERLIPSLNILPTLSWTPPSAKSPPATPGGDSGFCSAASSPDASHRDSSPLFTLRAPA